jgi:hypothetical protein
VGILPLDGLGQPALVQRPAQPVEGEAETFPVVEPGYSW